MVFNTRRPQARQNGLTQDGSNGSGKPEEHRIENGHAAPVAAQKQGFWPRYKRHCMRWWWLHLILFCAIFLLVALLLVYVGMPRIAQHGVNESSLEFTDIQFLEPTSDSVVLTQSAILHSPSIYTPRLDAFNASLYLVTGGVYGAVPMMTIPFPAVHAIHPQSIVGLNNTNVTFGSIDQVTDYTIAVQLNETVTTALVGKTKLHEGHLPTVEVNYNHTSTYKGLNGLKGFNVTGLTTNLSAATGEPNIKGFALIPNPSPLTIVMGNVTLNVSVGNEGVVGTSSIENFVLKPGNNSLPMTGILNETQVVAATDKSGNFNMTIVGVSAIYNGEHLPNYEAALKANVLTLTLNLDAILAASE